MVLNDRHPRNKDDCDRSVNPPPEQQPLPDGGVVGLTVLALAVIGLASYAMWNGISLIGWFDAACDAAYQEFRRRAMPY